jgi:hypothetical protein
LLRVGGHVSARNSRFPHAAHSKIWTRPGSLTCGISITRRISAWHLPHRGEQRGDGDGDEDGGASRLMFFGVSSNGAAAVSAVSTVLAKAAFVNALISRCSASLRSREKAHRVCITGRGSAHRRRRLRDRLRSRLQQDGSTAMVRFSFELASDLQSAPRARFQQAQHVARSVPREPVQ